MEYWVQGSLFDGDSVGGEHGNPTRAGAKARPKHRVGRLDWSRVTRDPAVAASYSDASRVASDFRVGLARAFGRLSPDERLAIRASLDRDSKRTAA